MDGLRPAVGPPRLSPTHPRATAGYLRISVHHPGAAACEGFSRASNQQRDTKSAWCYRDPMSRPNKLSGRFLMAGTGLLAWFALAGCDDGEKKPDTGYGAGQTPPSTVSCADLCRRTADCGAHLCAEDTGKDVDLYLSLTSAIESQCEASCSASVLSSNVTNTIWTCLFKSSCRQVFDYDACDMRAYYECK